VLARYANGSLGIFESTRYARGHKALYTLEINGEHGSFKWDLHDLNRLEWFDHRVEGRLRGWTTIHVTDGEHPYLGKWWVPGLIIGYEHSFVHQVADFLTGLRDWASHRPDLPRRVETQRSATRSWNPAAAAAGWRSSERLGGRLVRARLGGPQTSPY
jgi:predicted dehydrogenase